MTLAVAGRPGHTCDASVMNADVAAAAVEALLGATSKEPRPQVNGVGAETGQPKLASVMHGL